MTAEDLGKQAYQKLMLREYREAVYILNKAIAKYPDDHKLYINRCYCYIQLREFTSAMKDADSLISFFPEIPNGFFLRGEIYLLTGKYNLAEKDFTKLLRFESEEDLHEVHEKLNECCMQQIVQKGYEANVARKALRLSHNAEEALTLLASGLIKNGEEQKDNEWKFKLSEEEEEFFVKEFEKLEAGSWIKVNNCPKTKTTKAPKEEYIDPVIDPSNPGKYSSLWIVGKQFNLLENISKSMEKELEILFSEHGEVKNVNLHLEKKCLFVNYFSPKSASKAMASLQNYNFKGVIFQIEYSTAACNNNYIKK